MYTLEAMEIVFGTSNPAKIDDIRKIVRNPSIKLETLADLGLKPPEVAEDGATFEENAVIKYDVFRSLVPKSKILVTEDSGIEIDALNGAPGVYARRWSADGRDLSDQEIINKTLKLMKGRPNRTARFVSVLAFGGDGINKQTVRGELVGEILEQPDPKGAVPGFPYRALFYIPQLAKMLYEVHDIPLEQRNLSTHREEAWRKLERLIDNQVK